MKTSTSLNLNPELVRSVSVPGEHQINTVNSNHTKNNNNVKLTLNTQEANESQNKEMVFSDGGEFSITPTELTDPIFESTRRLSSGAIMSTDAVDKGYTEPDLSESSDRFYLLKKDSQRRLTLVRVLLMDKALIIDSWFKQTCNGRKDQPITKVKFSLKVYRYRG